MFEVDETSRERWGKWTSNSATALFLEPKCLKSSILSKIGTLKAHNTMIIDLDTTMEVPKWIGIIRSTLVWKEKFTGALSYSLDWKNSFPPKCLNPMIQAFWTISHIYSIRREYPSCRHNVSWWKLNLETIWCHPLPPYHRFWPNCLNFLKMLESPIQAFWDDFIC